jgi:hypothetical protein
MLVIDECFMISARTLSLISEVLPLKHLIYVWEYANDFGWRF